MANNAQLETLRELLRDTRSWTALGKVIGSAPASNGSVWRVKLELMPSGRQIIARVSRPSVGSGAGLHGPVSVGDLAVVVFPDASEDLGVVVSFLPSKEDAIPAQALQGHTVIAAIAGKKAYLQSLEKILVGLTTSTDMTENLVLGQVLKTLLSEMLQFMYDLADIASTHTHVGNLGASTSPPLEATDFSDVGGEFLALKADPVDNEAILSDIAFTEKGA